MALSSWAGCFSAMSEFTLTGITVNGFTMKGDLRKRGSTVVAIRKGLFDPESVLLI
jgi:hypothetical protein